MATTAYLKAIKPVSEQDAQKVVTYNELSDDFDKSIAGFLELSIAGTGDVPLGTFGRAQALNPIFKFTGVLTGNRTVFMPVSLGCARRFMVWNATTGAFTLTIKTTAVGSTGTAVTQTKKVDLFHDGTNVYAAGAEV